MTQPVFKHQEDDGDLSIFASGNVVVLACQHGHYWAVEAKQESTETVRRALEEVLPAEDAESLYRAM